MAAQRLQRDVERMKIALINENSQAAKNCVIHGALTAVVEPLGRLTLRPRNGLSMRLSRR